MNKGHIQYRPLGDIVVIKVDEPKKETASGIIIKEDWKTLPPTGKVVAVGDTVDRPIAIGDNVVFERYSSIILEDDLRLCKAANILAIRDEKLRD